MESFLKLKHLNSFQKYYGSRYSKEGRGPPLGCAPSENAEASGMSPEPIRQALSEQWSGLC